MAPLDTLANAGLTVTADGDRLLVRPRHLLTDDLRALIRDNKPEILAALSNAANALPLPISSDPWTAATLPETGDPPPVALKVGCNLQHSSEWDERRTCQQCRNLSLDGRCLAAWRGELFGVSRDFEPIKDMLQRCACYLPGLDDLDQREGRFAAYCISKIKRMSDGN